MRQRYLEKSLSAGETVIARAELHWYYFAVSFLWGIVSFLIFIIFMAIPRSGGGTISWWLQGICLITCPIALLTALWKLLRAFIMMYTCNFVLTDKRVIIKTGLLHVTTSEIMLNKMEGLSVRQSIFGRILNYGDLLITTGGVEQVHPKIKDVLEFHNLILEQMERNKVSDSAKAATAASANTIQALMRMVAQMQQSGNEAGTTLSEPPDAAKMQKQIDEQ